MPCGWKVALRKESVDRNTSEKLYSDDGVESLSARRAWIEMAGARDRAAPHASLSARRAWIEILLGCCRDSVFEVALRKESVDRNLLLVHML